MARRVPLICLMTVLLTALVFPAPVLGHGGDDDDEAIEVKIRKRNVILVPVVVVQHAPAVVITQGLVLSIRPRDRITIVILGTNGFVQPILITPATVVVGQGISVTTIRTRDVIVVRGVRNRHGTIVARRIQLVSRIRKG